MLKRLLKHILLINIQLHRFKDIVELMYLINKYNQNNNMIDDKPTQRSITVNTF